MILLRRRECALISVSLALLVISCRSQNDSRATETSIPETVVSLTPPFQTREPDRYRATRSITTVTAEGKSLEAKTFTARDGEMRRNESEVATMKLAYLDLPAGRFVLLPSEKVYAEVAAEINVPTSEEESPEGSAERLLHSDVTYTTYQKLGTELIAGRNANKYRIVVNSSTATNVSLSETLMWIDDALQMPIRSETKSSDGTHVTMELSDVALEVDQRIFQVPEDYEKITFTELRARLRRAQ